MEFRLWVDGALIDEQTVTMDESWTPDEAADAGSDVADAHLALVELAEARGLLWMVEVHEANHDTYRRFGTDARTMAKRRGRP
jgi:hypothetical protein